MMTKKQIASYSWLKVNSLSTECPLLITFANSFNPDQARSNLFDTLMVFMKEFFEKADFEKNQQTTKKHEKFPSMQKVKK